MRALVVRTAAGALFGAWALSCVAQRDALPAVPTGETFDALSATELAPRMGEAAAGLLEMLPAQGRREAEFDFADRERSSWDFWPSKFPGVRMDQVSADNRAAAHRLLRLGLSDYGYGKLALIQGLEPYNPWRSPYYSAAVFGDPSREGPWGWRFQGHHMSINFTIAGGEAIATTPLFLGSQPLSRNGVQGGAEPLADHEHRARELFRSLSGDQRSQTTIDRPPHTYLPERTPTVKRERPLGIAGSLLDSGQKELLVGVIRAYTDNIAPAIAETELGKMTAELDAVYFGWSGPDRPGRNHYYRVQGADFIIEYDSRDSGSHIHSVWRSYDGDFGGDLLREHYAQDHRVRARERSGL